LAGIAASVRTIDPKHWHVPANGSGKPGKDVSDWLAAGHTREQFDVLLVEQVAIQQDATGALRDKTPSSQGEIKFKLTSFDALRSSRTTEYLVKRVIPRRGLVVVWGPPKCGKSFWVFDVAMHIAASRFDDYRGHRVKHGEVVYLALEGQSGFPDRADAFRERFLEKGDTVPTFHLCGASLDLVKDHEKLTTDIAAQSAKPACVVIDTLNRSFAGSESSDEDMTAYVRAADAVQRAYDCVVIIVHHCGVNSDRPRGHTALTGAADVQIAVKKDAAGVIATTVEYAKDMEQGTTFAGRLDVVKLGLDQDGDEITSCVVTPLEACDQPMQVAPKAKKVRVAGTRRAFDEAFLEALDNTGQSIVVRAGSPAVRAVEIPHVRTEFGRRHATDNEDPKKRADAQRQAFQRVLAKLPPEYDTCIQADREWIFRRSG
jgi:hypothetical protein